MPGAIKNFIGLEGFIWWIGVVEDRQDPEQLGRVRVRCFGWHSDDKSLIPTDALPWAHPVLPVNSPNVYTPKEGDMVFGFFVDGTNGQNPAIVGVLPGKPDTKPKYEAGFSDPGENLSKRPKKPDDSEDKYPKSKYLNEPTLNRLSRSKADGTIIATRRKNLKKNVKSAGGNSWSEPAPTFKPVYPYNNALETESGHAFELDDTPGNERVHLAHRSGAYMEYDKDGSKVQRVQKNAYTVIMGDDYIYVKGKAVITVEGNFNLRTSIINVEASEINMAADGAVKIKGSSVKIESTGAMDLKSGGEGNITAGGTLNLKGSSTRVTGSSVDINGTLNAGSTNMKATGSDSRGDSHNLTVAGTGGAAAADATGTGLTGGGTAASQEEQEAATNTSATAANTSANTAASANAVGTGTSTSAAAVGIDATQSPLNQLEEVTVMSKKVEGNTNSTVLGKTLAGVTSTISSVNDVLGKAAESIISDFSNGLPTDIIAGKVSGFGSAINDNAPAVLSLQSSQKLSLLTKIDSVSKLAYNNGVDFKFDTSVQNELLSKVYGVGESQLTNTIAKRVYPKTETFKTNNLGQLSLNKDVLLRMQSQTDESQVNSQVAELLSKLSPG